MCYDREKMEQFIFSDNTIEWLKCLSLNFRSVGAIFVPSLLSNKNVIVYDQDPDYSGENYICCDLSDPLQKIEPAELYIIDPPFFTYNKDYRKSVLLDVLSKLDPSSRILICLSNYLAMKPEMQYWIRRLSLHPYREFIPTYIDIGNSYVDFIAKKRGKTSILFWTNFVPHEIDGRLFSINITDGVNWLNKRSVVLPEGPEKYN